MTTRPHPGRGRPDPALAAVRRAVEAVLVDRADAGVLVACSGGADSLALAAATAFLVRARGVRGGAVVVDHGLQQGSAETARAAAATCAAWGLDPVVVKRVSITPTSNGLEADAREARYRALAHAARKAGADVVLLGHTLEDQAETVLMALARGSGGRSLAGMAPERGENPTWVRPLLGLHREQVRAAAVVALAEVAGHPGVLTEPWEDPHNADDAFTRSRVRSQALPALAAQLGPGVAVGLARSASLLRADADHLDALATELLAEVSDPDGSLDAEALNRAPRALRTRVLRMAAEGAGCPAGSVTSVQVEAMEALVCAWRGQGEVSLPRRVGANRRYGRLYFTGAVVRDNTFEEPM